MLDHLGSPVAVYDGSAAVQERLSFGTWGNRRDYDTLVALDYYNTAFVSGSDTDTVRGYTGHEHGDAFGIIHMNGRIYDPHLGRMLQADPLIQFPANTQSYNRYSYVLNNPLSATDPSGYFIGAVIGAVLDQVVYRVLPDSLHAPLNAVLTVAAANVCGPCAIAVSAYTSAQSAYAQTGDFKQAATAGAYAGVSSAAFYAVGQAFVGDGALAGLEGPGKFASQVGLHGLTGGVLAEIQGGKFGHGFLAAGLAKGSSLGAAGADWNMQGQFLAAVVTGGTVSHVTGGKFANGAMTATFAFAANQVTTSGQFSKDVTDRQIRALGRGAKALHGKIEGLTPEEMVEMFPDLAGLERTPLGRTNISAHQQRMLADLKGIWIPALRDGVLSGYANVLAVPLDTALSSVSKAYSVYSTLSHELVSGGWFEPDFAVQVGCGTNPSTGCQGAIITHEK